MEPLTSICPTASARIGERLRWLRGLADMSARELDRLAGRRQGHVSLIESPRRNQTAVNTDTANSLARVFGVSLDWLVNGVGAEPDHAAVRAAVAARRATAADHEAA